MSCLEIRKNITTEKVTLTLPKGFVDKKVKFLVVIEEDQNQKNTEYEFWDDEEIENIGKTSATQSSLFMSS